MSHPLSACLRDETVVLEPIGEQHTDAIRAACNSDPDIWSIYPINLYAGSFDASFAFLRSRPNWFGFAVISVPRSEVVGMTHFIDPTIFGVVEIGATFITPMARGTGLNGAMKTLMIDHAFANGFEKVEFRIDTRNTRSMAAAAKLGAFHEGTIRQNLVTWNGFRRDTAIFGLLRNEWQDPAHHAARQGNVNASNASA